MDEIESAVADLVRRQLPADAADRLTADAPLADLGLGSLKTVGFLVDLEEHFGVVFPADAIRADTFRDVRTVAGVVRSLTREL